MEEACEVGAWSQVVRTGHGSLCSGQQSAGATGADTGTFWHLGTQLLWQVRQVASHQATLRARAAGVSGETGAALAAGLVTGADSVTGGVGMVSVILSVYLAIPVVF